MDVRVGLWRKLSTTNWFFWTVVLEKTLESPLDCKEIQPVHSKRDQSWVFFGRNDVKAEATVIWTPHAKCWLIGKDSDVGRDWGQEENWMTEDEMDGWHHGLNGRETEWTLGDGDGQGGLACCNSWHHKESNTTEQLNWTELNWTEGQLSWEIDGETMETVSDFILGGSKITADGDCSYEIKRSLLLGRKVMTNLDSIFKSRDITLPTKIHLVKAMVFPVAMCRCESWTVRKAECQRIDAFELWCWRRLLRIPWTTRRSSQSILKEISPGCSLEGNWNSNILAT